MERFSWILETIPIAARPNLAVELPVETDDLLLFHPKAHDPGKDVSDNPAHQI